MLAWYIDQIRNTGMWNNQLFNECRAGSMAPTTSKMKLFMTITNSLQPLIFVIKSSILDIAVVLDPSLACLHYSSRKELLVE